MLELRIEMVRCLKMEGGTIGEGNASVWRTVISGKTREALIAGAATAGHPVHWVVEPLISEPEFVISAGVSYRLVFIRGYEFGEGYTLWDDYEIRQYSMIMAEGARRGYQIPPAEVALLLAQIPRVEYEPEKSSI